MFFLFDHQLIYCKKVPRVILPCWMGLLRAAVAGLRLRARSSCPEKTSHTHAVPLPGTVCTGGPSLVRHFGPKWGEGGV